jgi:hypothetical protein
VYGSFCLIFDGPLIIISDKIKEEKREEKKREEKRREEKRREEKRREKRKEKRRGKRREETRREEKRKEKKRNKNGRNRGCSIVFQKWSLVLSCLVLSYRVASCRIFVESLVLSCRSPQHSDGEPFDLRLLGLGLRSTLGLER